MVISSLWALSFERAPLPTLAPKVLGSEPATSYLLVLPGCRRVLCFLLPHFFPFTLAVQRLLLLHSLLKWEGLRQM